MILHSRAWCNIGWYKYSIIHITRARIHLKWNMNTFSQQKNILTWILCANHSKYLHVTKIGLKWFLHYCSQFYDKSCGKTHMLALQFQIWWIYCIDISKFKCTSKCWVTNIVIFLSQFIVIMFKISKVCSTKLDKSQ